MNGIIATLFKNRKEPKMNSKKKKVVGVTGLIIAAVVLIVAFALAKGKYTIILNQEQIQKRIDAQLPKGTNSVQVTSAQISFVEDNLDVLITVNGSKFGKNVSVTARSVGIPSYDPLEGTFRFNPEQITIEKFSSDLPPLKDGIKKAADRYVTNSGIRNILIDAAPRVDVWVKQLVERGITEVLNRTPVYRLKNDPKSLLVRASLQSININHDTLQIVVSLWQLTLSVLYCLVIGISIFVAGICFLFAAARSPGTVLLLSV